MLQKQVYSLESLHLLDLSYCLLLTVFSQLKTQEEEITNIKSELAIMELEVQVIIIYTVLDFTV